MKVKCIDNHDDGNYLTVGKVYDVVSEDGWGYYVVNDEHYETIHAKGDFEVVDEHPLRNKYSREIRPGVWVDCYDVLRAFNVTDPCLQHLAKKALAGGQRGHKDLGEDLRDILASAKRAVEMYEEWSA